MYMYYIALVICLHTNNKQTMNYNNIDLFLIKLHTYTQLISPFYYSHSTLMKGIPITKASHHHTVVCMWTQKLVDNIHPVLSSNNVTHNHTQLLQVVDMGFIMRIIIVWNQLNSAWVTNSSISWLDICICGFIMYNVIVSFYVWKND